MLLVFAVVERVMNFFKPLQGTDDTSISPASLTRLAVGFPEIAVQNVVHPLRPVAFNGKLVCCRGTWLPGCDNALDLLVTTTG
jgi:hypothetical protein